MVEKIINKVVSVLVEEELIYEDEREKYIYAYTCILEKFITITCILFISILKGDFLFTIIFLLAFFFLRRRTGGFHLNSFSGCFIGTVSVSIAISRISRIFVNKIPVIILLDIVSFLIILIKGTVNHPNIQMNNDELLVSKKKARMIACLEMMIILVLFFIDVSDELVVYLSYALILCALLIIAAKIAKQEVGCKKGKYFPYITEIIIEKR